MRTFSLKDDCTLSGRRLRRDERRVEGGGYVDRAGGPLLPAHGVMLVPADGMKPGEKEVPPQIRYKFGNCHRNPRNPS